MKLACYIEAPHQIAPYRWDWAWLGVCYSYNFLFNHYTILARFERRESEFKYEKPIYWYIWGFFATVTPWNVFWLSWTISNLMAHCSSCCQTQVWCFVRCDFWSKYIRGMLLYLPLPWSLPALVVTHKDISVVVPCFVISYYCWNNPLHHQCSDLWWPSLKTHVVCVKVYVEVNKRNMIMRELVCLTPVAPPTGIMTHLLLAFFFFFNHKCNTFVVQSNILTRPEIKCIPLVLLSFFMWTVAAVASFLYLTLCSIILLLCTFLLMPKGHIPDLLPKTYTYGSEQTTLS